MRNTKGSGGKGAWLLGQAGESGQLERVAAKPSTVEMRRGSDASSREQRPNRGENQGLGACWRNSKPKSKANKTERSRAETRRAARGSQRAQHRHQEYQLGKEEVKG